jgi:ubiquinone/menaquinone biosynthesis C-methylase UbiE
MRTLPPRPRFPRRPRASLRRLPARARGFLRWYGGSPLHLLTMAGSFALAGYAAAELLPNNLIGIPVWFVGAVIGHDLILMPLYTLADRSAQAVFRHSPLTLPAVPAINYLRVPAGLSALLLLIWFPLILRRPTRFPVATTLSLDPYLWHWLGVTGALFLLSATAFALRLGTARRAQRRPETDETAAARQERVWDQAAPDYDRRIAFFERTWFPGAREWLGQRARGEVLEVAVGTGRSLPCYPADVTLAGVELSPAMLALARRRAAGLGLPVDLREGDAQRLPFADASFDTVVCALGLCTIPSPVAAVAEMHRVLRPGGRLLLLDHTGSTWPPVYAAQWLLERVTIRTAGEHFTRRQLPLVTAAGFQVVAAERLKAGTIERIHAVKPPQMPGDPKTRAAERDPRAD